MSTAGYSGTPLAKKLGYKPEFIAHLINAPDNYLDLVSPLPEGVQFANEAAQSDLVHFFSMEAAEVATLLPELMNAIKRNGMIWVSWPKRASKVPTDVTEDTIRRFALPLGLVDVKVCAVDSVWSGLKLVIRKELR